MRHFGDFGQIGAKGLGLRRPPDLVPAQGRAGLNVAEGRHLPTCNPRRVRAHADDTACLITTACPGKANVSTSTPRRAALMRLRSRGCLTAPASPAKSAHTLEGAAQGRFYNNTENITRIMDSDVEAYPYAKSGTRDSHENLEGGPQTVDMGPSYR